MDISFIIPCHNLEDYIKPLLLSIQAMDLSELTYEFIFVLDDCTDNTEQIIIDYLKDYQIKIIKCNHHSCGLARNEGLEIAKGEFIWFLDGDDWVIYPFAAKECLKIMRENNTNMIRVTYVSNYYKMFFPSMVWQYIYRRSLIGDIRFKSIQPHEDIHFMREINTKTKAGDLTLYNIPTYFYNYARPGSNTTQMREKGKIEP